MLATKNVEVKLRHSNIKYKAEIISMKEINGKFEMSFKLAEKVFAITPGQELVMYKNKICLGGGKIK